MEEQEHHDVSGLSAPAATKSRPQTASASGDFPRNCDTKPADTKVRADMPRKSEMRDVLDCDLGDHKRAVESAKNGYLDDQVASTSRCNLSDKCSDSENNDIPTNAMALSVESAEFKAPLVELKQECESDVQSTCSTGNLNESRESVFYSDQSSESNTASAAVIKNVDNTSLCNLLIYTSDDSESDSSTDEELDDYESSPEDRTAETPASKQSKPGKSDGKAANISETLRAMNDLNIEDLPPVPDPRNLKVEVQEKDCEKMGTISSIIDEIVMVESLPNMPAYDSDTLLFLDKGKQPLGYVYDVIGPVSQPLYAIRFNTVQEITALNISKGLPVYSAPKTEHTQFVFLKELMKMKGSDASWKNDMETPQEYVDFSDDEQETTRKSGKSDSTPGPHCNRKRNSLERHQTFEKDMNVRNLIDTRLHKIRDTYEPTNKKYTPQNAAVTAPPTFAKRGFPFPQIWNRPQFAFSTQPNTSFAQMPHVSGVIGTFTPRVTPPMPMGATFTNLPPNVATFVPHIPPPMLPAGFRPNIPPPPIARTPINMENVPPPIFQNFAVAPPMQGPAKTQPDTRQSNTPMCMYPANMGLPRGQAMPPQPQPLLVTSGNNIPPNMAFFRPPQMQQWFTYPNPMAPQPPVPQTRSFSGIGRGYYPHKRP